MQIQSFSLGYSHEEDRLLLQASLEGQSHQYWVSRRAALMLAEAIQTLLKKQYDLLGVSTGDTRLLADLAAFGHDAAVEKFPASKAGDSTNTNTDSALLLYQVRYAVIDANTAQLALMDRLNCGFSYVLTRDLLHTLLNLLESQCKSADWISHSLLVFNHQSSLTQSSSALH